jgi:hypothetical protein
MTDVELGLLVAELPEDFATILTEVLARLAVPVVVAQPTVDVGV